MKLTFVKPRPELQPYIQSFWVFESPIGMPPTENSLAAPNGCPKLIILYENSITSIAGGHVQKSHEQGLYFVGNRDSSTLLHTSPRKTCFIGIEFYAYGAYPIFGIPMVEAVNRLLSADELFSVWGRKVREILRNLESVRGKIDFIQAQLVQILEKNRLHNPIVEYCVNSLKAANGLMTISALERRTGYSRRYLEILFQNHVGFSPKVMAGIFRFQRFYRKWAQRRPYGELREELYDFYYDQSHFTKEFRRMTGFSPQHFSLEVSNEFGRRLSLH
jgi:AraC-like DNA-binding protein